MLVNIIGKELDLFRSLGVGDMYCLNYVGIWFQARSGKKETELKNEIDRLDSEIVKAKKNLDMARPGVSLIYVCNNVDTHVILIVIPVKSQTQQHW